MYVICSRSVVDLCRTSGERWGFVSGQVRDQDLYQIHSAGSASTGAVPPDALGVWALPDAVAEAVQAPGCLLVVVKEASGEFWTRREDGRLGDQLDGMIVDVSQDLFRRLRGVVDQSQLQQRVVTIVGCGSLGSGIACLLVVAGLGSIILIDRDRLETHNVIRHLCGVSDLGRFKVHAVADRLRDKNPGVVVEAWPVDAAEKHDVLVDAIRRSDLVIAATDSPQAQLMINADAIAAGKPALYPGAYNFAFGGESIRVIPGRTACLRCVYDATAELFQRSEPGANGQTAAYDADRGHPGMWIDVGFIAHLAARMAVETLLGQHDPAVNLTGHYLLWGNRRMWAFDRPLHHRWLKVRRNPTCPACGGEAAMEAQLASHGLDRPSAEAEGRRVLETVHPDCDGLVSGLIGWRRSPFV